MRIYLCGTDSALEYVNFKNGGFYETESSKSGAGNPLAVFVLAIVFVEVNTVVSVSKVMRAEKNFKTIQSI
ncbi:MAG: hypothetical protein AB7T10_00670 [bacterium]